MLQSNSTSQRFGALALACAVLAACTVVVACGGATSDVQRITFSEEQEANAPGGASPSEPQGDDDANALEPQGEGEASPLLPSCTSSSTLTGDVTIRSQEEVDALAGCEEVEGSLSIRGAQDASGAPLDLSPLTTLRTVPDRLTLEGLPSLNGLEGLRNVGSLQVVDIEADLAPLANLSGEVEDLVVGGVPGARSLEVFRGLIVTERLSLGEMPDLESLEGPVLLATPRSGEASSSASLGIAVSIDGAPRLKDLSTLRIASGAETCLQDLSLSDLPALERLRLPANITCVERVLLRGDGPSVLDEVAALDGLTTLHLIETTASSLGSAPFASPQLRRLWIEGAENLVSLEALTGATALEQVTVERAHALVELDVLATLPELQRLVVDTNASLQRLPVFEQLDGARGYLFVRGNPRLEVAPEFPLLEALTDSYRYQIEPEARSLGFRSNPLLTSIGSFPRLREVNAIFVSNMDRVAELSLPALQTAQIIRVNSNEALARIDLPNLQGTTRFFAQNNAVLDEVAIVPGQLQLDELFLTRNPALSQPAIDLLLSAVSPNGTASIDGNRLQ